MAKTKTKAKGYRSHKYAKLFPVLSGEAYKAIKAEYEGTGSARAHHAVYKERCSTDRIATKSCEN